MLPIIFMVGLGIGFLFGMLTAHFTKEEDLQKQIDKLEVLLQKDVAVFDLIVDVNRFNDKVTWGEYEKLQKLKSNITEYRTLIFQLKKRLKEEEAKNEQEN